MTCKDEGPLTEVSVLGVVAAVLGTIIEDECVGPELTYGSTFGVGAEFLFLFSW